MEYFVPEEMPVDTLVGNIIIDFGLDLRYGQETVDGLRFSFLARQPPPGQHHQQQQQQQQQQLGSELFVIDERSGVIRTRVRIDRESVCPRQDVCSVRLDIAVQPASTRSLQILGARVEILDINDNAPAFPESRTFIRISESAEPGTGFVIADAVDPDAGRNGVRSYDLDQRGGVDETRDSNEISDGDKEDGDGDGGKFELKVTRTADGARQLRIVLRGRLDRERASSHSVVVKAVDGGSPARTGSTVVVIEVQDANDNRPVFGQHQYEVRIKKMANSALIIVDANAYNIYNFIRLIRQPQNNKNTNKQK